jgi:predicted ATP-grasp superfamily ATP-dependent carboligase
MTAPLVLVTDGDQRAALAITRSLGKAGYRVLVAGPATRSLASVSRWAEGGVAAHRGDGHPAAFVDAIAEIVRSRQVAVVLPVTEASLLALLPARDRLAPALVPFATAEAFRAVSDKHEVLSRAARFGIEVPRSVRLETSGDIDAGLAEVRSFPVVVKPERSVRAGASGVARLSVVHARDAAELAAVLRALPPEAFPLQVQQRIVGPGTGLFFLIWNDRVALRFSHRRLREKPPAGGVSVYAESVAFDEALGAKALALLRSFGWEGVAMVEFKRDRDSGTPCLMEINGRFWGSLQLAIDADADFPRRLVDLALDRAGGDEPVYRVGQRCRWWWGDIDQMLTRLRRRRDDLHLPPGTPGRLRAIAEVLMPGWSPGRNEVMRWDDRAPAWFETGLWFRSLR